MTDDVAKALILVARPLSSGTARIRTGDLVVEVTHQGCENPDAIGYLVEVYREYPLFDTGVREEWVVEPLRTKGGTVTWVGAEFFKVSPEVAILVKALS